MAGDWIKMDVTLPDKPEVWRIAGCLGIEPDAVVGKLLRVWSWFDAHTEDGNAVGVTPSLVDRVTGVAGFGAAMLSTGWLTHQDGVLSVPRFSRHNGKTAKNRALTNERVAAHRSRSNAESNADSNAESVTKTVTREEKRREEKKIVSLTETLPARKRAARTSGTLGVDDLVEAGVDRQHAADWLAIRVAKKLPLTATAWTQTKAEAASAGVGVGEAVRLAAENGWAGFRAAWLQNEGRNGSAQHGPSNRDDAAIRKIEEDSRKAAEDRERDPDAARRVLETARAALKRV